MYRVFSLIVVFLNYIIYLFIYLINITVVKCRNMNCNCNLTDSLLVQDGPGYQYEGVYPELPLHAALWSGLCSDTIRATGC